MLEPKSRKELPQRYKKSSRKHNQHSPNILVICDMPIHHQSDNVINKIIKKSGKSNPRVYSTCKTFISHTQSKDVSLGHLPSSEVVNHIMGNSFDYIYFMQGFEIRFSTKDLKHLINAYNDLNDRARRASKSLYAIFFDEDGICKDFNFFVNTVKSSVFNYDKRMFDQVPAYLLQQSLPEEGRKW